MVSQKLQIALVASSYVFVSITMVFTNKKLMATSNISIPAPFFLIWFQCVVTALICWFLGEIRSKHSILIKINY